MKNSQIHRWLLLIPLIAVGVLAPMACSDYGYYDDHGYQQPSAYGYHDDQSYRRDHYDAETHNEYAELDYDEQGEWHNEQNEEHRETYYEEPREHRGPPLPPGPWNRHRR